MQTKIEQFQTFAFPNQDRVRTVVLAGIAVLALFVSMYVYVVGKIVFDVVAQRGAESSIRASQSAISSLEADYYVKIQSVTLADAGQVGLSESRDTLFASRSDFNATAFLSN